MLVIERMTDSMIIRKVSKEYSKVFILFFISPKTFSTRVEVRTVRRLPNH